MDNQNDPFAAALLPTDKQPVTQADADDPFAAALIANNPKQEGTDFSGTFMAGVDALNRQFEKVALGVEQIAAYPIDKAFGTNLNQKILDANKYGSSTGTIVGEQQYQQSKAAHPIASTVGDVGGVIGAASIGGGVGLAKIAPNLLGQIASRTLGTTAVGAGYGLIARPTDTLSEKFSDVAIGGAIGGVAANIIPMARGMLNMGRSVKNVLTGSGDYASSMSARMFNPEKAALQDRAFQAASGIGNAAIKANPEQAVTQVDDALKDFNKLGMKATPGQGLGDLEIRGSEYATPAGMIDKAKYKEFNMEQRQVLKDKLTGTIKNMATDDTKALKDKMYQALADKQVPDEAAQNLMADPEIQKVLSNLGGTDLHIAQLPNNSVTKLEYIRDAIDNRIWNSDKAFDAANKLDSVSKDALLQARNRIVTSLDQAYPEIYPVARQAAQKVAIQRNYVNLLKDVRNSTGEVLNIPADIGAKLGPEELNAVTNLTKVNAALFGTDSKIASFLDDVAKTGGDIETAKAVIGVTGRLAGTSLDQVVKRAPQSLSQYVQDGRNAGVVATFLNKLINGRYDRALTELTLSGKWSESIKKEIINQANKSKQTTNFMKLINKVSNGIKDADTVLKADGMGMAGGIGGNVRDAAVLGTVQSSQPSQGYLSPAQPLQQP